MIDVRRIRADARAARARGADMVVVALHWGSEYVHEPTAVQRRLARRLLMGPDIDLLYGHHAHVVQPVDRAASGPSTGWAMRSRRRASAAWTRTRACWPGSSSSVTGRAAGATAGWTGCPAW